MMSLRVHFQLLMGSEPSPPKLPSMSAYVPAEADIRAVPDAVCERGALIIPALPESSVGQVMQQLIRDALLNALSD